MKIQVICIMNDRVNYHHISKINGTIKLKYFKLNKFAVLQNSEIFIICSTTTNRLGIQINHNRRIPLLEANSNVVQQWRLLSRP